MTRPEAPDDATRAQIDAAEPGVSTWLSANAGSGKTRVLTDRVARLLLRGTPPERILCLTYTKAAAAEMQNRLFRRLGDWAMQDDAVLRAELAALGEGPDLPADLLARARRLFAAAIEAPGGLKIQTIHAFCSAVLRRFPLEAGVAPGFTEMDNRAGARLIDEVLDAMAGGEDRAAIDAVAPLVGGDDGLAVLAKAVAGRREDFGQGPADMAGIWGWFGAPRDLREDDIVARAFDGREAAIWSALHEVLDSRNRNDAAFLRACGDIDWTCPDLRTIQRLEGKLLTGKDAQQPFSAKSDALFNSAKRAALGPRLHDLNALCERIEAVRPLRTALAAARRTEALHAFAGAFLPRLAAAKARRGWLDFDDLIHRTRHLLTDRPMAQWVLFRLDGGIDHILVDEAQDTSPAQWQIIRQLAAEFAGGAGARADVRRTIFVVGDKKQSIYSFQGADPDGFDRMQAYFRDQISAAGGGFFARELQYSFRSAPPILALVDRVFRGPAGHGLGDAPTHLAHKADMPGRVDLWPAVPATKGAEPAPWPRPVDSTAQTHHSVTLAARIVAGIEAMIAQAAPVGPAEARRPVRPGDILILVQRRSGLYPPLAAALKASGLPFAGADVFRVAADLAVRDLAALLRFVASSDDDLSLATALRSPLLGWSEAELYALAQGRPGRLWQALRAWKGPTLSVLQDLRDNADFLRPYDLVERILIRHDGRRRLLQRLGPEAGEGIDAMLDQALAYERSEVPSLLGFTSWLAAEDVSVKRTLTGDEGVVRLMTVHGAKGLEAPVVILPDTAAPKGGGNRLTLHAPQDGPVIWPPPAEDRPAVVEDLVEARAAADAAERRRLLYVAMTRAENWLIVAAAGNPGDDPSKSWYRAVEEGLTQLGAARAEFGPLGTGLRLQTGDWQAIADPPSDAGRHGAGEGSAGTGPSPDLPVWAMRPAPAAHPAMPVRSPSDLGGAKALPGEDAAGPLDAETGAVAGADPQDRGTRIHRLLEHLPAVARGRWAALASGLLADLEPAGPEAADDTDALLAEVGAILDAAELAPLFATGTLGEVTIAGPSPALNCRLAGQVDRLVVAPDHVLAVDFKSNAAVPATPEAVPEGLLRQLGAYAEMLASIYPGRDIRTAILWTRTATLMPVPAALTRAALARASPA